jgi:membrane-associated phospholipid phosphatase
MTAGNAPWLARRFASTTPRGLSLTIVVLAAVLCAALFGVLLHDVVANEGAVRLDPGVTRFLVEHRSDGLDAVMRGVTWLGSNAVLIPLIALLVVFVGVIRRDAWGALLAALALAGADALYSLVKPIVDRPRPPVAIHLVHASNFSFPSGHATAVTACFGMAAALLAADRSLRWKLIAGIAAGVVVVVVGFSRIYLGVHWFTDVVAGVALGGLWLCVLWTIALLAGVRTASSGSRRGRTGGPPPSLETADPAP